MSAASSTWLGGTSVQSTDLRLKAAYAAAAVTVQMHVDGADVGAGAAAGTRCSSLSVRDAMRNGPLVDGLTREVGRGRLGLDRLSRDDAEGDVAQERGQRRQRLVEIEVDEVGAGAVTPARSVAVPCGSFSAV